MRSHTSSAFRSPALLAILVLTGLTAGVLVPLSASDPGTSDWPMWGGTADRNMVSNMTGLPTEWDVDTGTNVAWVADLGSQSYGNPVVADGVVVVGTNNELLRDPEQGGDRGVLMAFRESDGQFLWQQTNRKLESGRANDWPFQGVASSPLVQNGRLFYVSNRGVVMSLDPRGLPRRGKRWSRHRRGADGPAGRRHHLGLRHDGGGRRVPAQPVELVAGHLRQPDLPEHLERPRREPRQRTVAPRAVDHRARLAQRRAGLGGQFRAGPDPPRAVVHAHRRRDRRCQPGRLRAGRRLGARLRRPGPARSSGSSTPTRRTRCGRAPATR